MARKKTNASDSEKIVELLQNLVIIQLGSASVGQKEIRDIVGCDMNRINRIVKLLRPKRSVSKGEQLTDEHTKQT